MKLKSTIFCSMIAITVLCALLIWISVSSSRPSGESSAAGAFFAAIGSFWVAAVGLFAIFATLQIQNQPLLTLEFECKNAEFVNNRLYSHEGKEIDQLWFAFKNVGNSSGKIIRFNRQWKLVENAADIAALDVLEIEGEGSIDTFHVAPAGGLTAYIKSRLQDTEDRNFTLMGQDTAGGTKNIPVFMVCAEYEDLLGQKYIARFTYLIWSGKIHQAETGAAARGHNSVYTI